MWHVMGLTITGGALGYVLGLIIAYFSISNGYWDFTRSEMEEFVYGTTLLGASVGLGGGLLMKSE